MANKSIAILGSRGIPANYGGFETFAEELSTRLVDKGFSVTVYCEANTGEEALDSFRGVQLVQLPVSRLGPLTTIVFDARCLWHARRSFDVVYMLGYGASLFFFVPRLWGSELWVNMDGIEWVRSKWNFLARTWLRTMESIAMWFATRIIADAAAIRDHLERRHRRRKGVAVIPYGAPIVEYAPDASALSEFEINADEYYLIVCRLEPENHVTDIVSGFISSDSKYPLVVVGDIDADTPYAQTLREIADPRVRFVGTIFDQGKLTMLRWHCRAYFHGHSVGGTNPSLLEALGCGNRVVAHDNPFNREVAADCAQYFATDGEILPIVRNLDAVPPDGATRKQAQDRIRAAYSWSQIADKYERLLA